MNAECRELKVYVMDKFDIESIIEEDAIAMANDMYSIDDCYTVACNLLEEY